MTGMAATVSRGARRSSTPGARSFGQDGQTSVVYGMNKAAFQERAIQSQFALGDLPALIQRLARGGSRPACT